MYSNLCCEVILNPQKSVSHNSHSYEEKVLQVAERLFVKHGYGRVSLKMIIAHTGGSFATFYKHFGSKEQLFERVIKKRHRIFLKKFEDELVNGVNAGGNSVRDSLMGYGKSFLAHISNEDNLAFMRLLITELNTHRQLAYVVEQYFSNSPVDILSEFLTKCVERGFLPSHDTFAGAGLFSSMVVSHLDIWLLLFEHHREFLTQEVINSLVERAITAFFAWLEVQDTLKKD